MLFVAKRYTIGEARSTEARSTEAESAQRISTKATSTLVTSTDSESTKETSTTPTPKWFFRVFVASSSLFLVFGALVASHIGPHPPGQHGELPIEIQAALSVIGLLGLSLISYGSLVEWLRLKRGSKK
jgi:hypothetical protein